MQIKKSKLLADSMTRNNFSNAFIALQAMKASRQKQG